MSSKPVLNSVATIFIRTIGGGVCSMATLAPKLGPLGISPKKITELLTINTLKWEGLKVICKIVIINKEISVTVVPSASVLLIQSLNRPARNKKQEKNISEGGNISIDTIISIAKSLKKRAFLNNLRGCIKEVIGTALSLKCLVENKTHVILK